MSGLSAKYFEIDKLTGGLTPAFAFSLIRSLSRDIWFSVEQSFSNIVLIFLTFSDVHSLSIIVE
ncbi:hypothetical protein GCM10017554_31180 [Acinetobacter modestus]|nr:hypothetical protein GCM10017554_31180 [Acinetobacter modestus]